MHVFTPVCEWGDGYSPVLIHPCMQYDIFSTSEAHLLESETKKIQYATASP